MNTPEHTAPDSNSQGTPILYTLSLALCGAGFAIFFFSYVFPPVLETYDIIGAFAAGFVNPFATGYSVDVITCWVILAIWVIHEKLTQQIRYGWIALLLGAVPGVATGFALYLIIRARQKAQ